MKQEETAVFFWHWKRADMSQRGSLNVAIILGCCPAPKEMKPRCQPRTTEEEAKFHSMAEPVLTAMCMLWRNEIGLIEISQ